ncbi:MAG: hypothetical protein AAB513_01025 [Patescibacteria group bacterium]
MFLRKIAEKIASSDVGMRTFNFEPIFVAPFIFSFLVWGIWVYDTKAVLATSYALIILAPIWLPLYLLVIFWVFWIDYIRFKYWLKHEMVLLEIQLPPEVEKSPLAMELFLSSLWNAGGETTFIQRIWKGQFRPIWTFEIASREGRVGFYIHLRKAFRNIVEARLYGQFPEIKIVEAEDYINDIPPDLKGYELWGTEYKKSEPQALPLKTYTHYEMDKDPDTPETTVDPISNILELFSTIGQGEYMWLQIVTKARKKDEWNGFYLSADHYQDPAKEKIQEITKEAVERAKELISNEEEKEKVGTRGKMLLSESEKEKIEALEQSLTKLIFECGIRTTYVARKENYNFINISQFIRFFDSYRYPGYNALGVTRGMQVFDYPWQDFRNIRRNILQKNLLMQSRNRSYFYTPYEQEPVFMTTEELATIWHFPSSSVKTPSLSRVGSRRSEPPSNLPR